MYRHELVDRPSVRMVQRLARRPLVIGVAAITALASTVGIAAATTRSSGSSAAEPPATIASRTSIPEPEASEPPAVTSTTTSTTTTSTSSTTSTSVVGTSTTSTTSTTIDPASLLPTLRLGDTGPEVVMLQRMLNNSTGTELVPDGVYGPDTVTAVAALQTIAGLDVTGEADHETRTLLAELDDGRSSALPTWALPTIGNGGANGCQVTVLGDSLIAYSVALHADALRAINCSPGVDGVGGRSLAYGWQCRVAKPGGRNPLLLLPAPEPGNTTCAPSGLELVRMWRDAGAFGDIVVIALGTNDAGLFDEARWIRNWDDVLRMTGDRPVVFLTTKARPNSVRSADLDRYAAVLRRWCDNQPRCFLADWALTSAATDPASYVDPVHLTRAATIARANFIRDAVSALFAGRPLPNPAPIPIVVATVPSTTTTTTTVPPATTTTMPPSTTTTTSSTTTTTTLPAATTTTTSTTTTSTTISAPATTPEDPP